MGANTACAPGALRLLITVHGQSGIDFKRAATGLWGLDHQFVGLIRNSEGGW